MLAPYRCRDCKTRFWGRDSNAYLVTAVGIGSVLLLGSLTWIGFSSDESVERSPLLQPQTASTIDSLQSSSQLPSPSPSAKPTLTEAIARGENIDLQSVKSENTNILPNPDDNRLYTINLFLEKAKKGNADAQYQLGILYLTGKGTLQDFSEASKWFISAAEQNHPLAQYELGLLYQIGQGVEMDNEKSYMWLNLAAAAGIEQAALARDKVMRLLSRTQLASAQKAAREWLTSRNKSEK
ncbi:tetratricopeptide repeat protein [Nitrosomonas sp.]|uniref:tetratricopeptide repeat protein n=1 Tax=Nitrosomonas sp. TaxID=42353 RepID=UPI0025CF9A43|nr:tetratricopeptide repeat protein [Nitrosomonas sp.]